MASPLETIGGHRRIAVVGLAKNAGKTTTLNAFVHHVAGSGATVGLCSIGRDGEDEDVLTRLPKPRVTVPAGSYCVTTDRLAGDLELIETLDEPGALGRPGIYRCPPGSRGSGCAVVLVGVNRLSMVRRALAALDTRVDVVFVDGAFDRRGSAMPDVTDGVVLATGGAVGNSLELIAERTTHVVQLIHLPVCAPGSGLLVRVPGALTYRRFRAYADDAHGVGCLCVRDWTRVFLDHRELAGVYAAGWTICCETGACLLAVTTNPFNPDGSHFDRAALLHAVQARLSRAGFAVPCFDVGYERG